MTLELRNVSTTYPRGVRALNDVSLTIPAGLFGLLGPNGAGKSTLMRTIATLQRPDTGSIRLGNIDLLADPARGRATIGFLPQDFGLYPRLSAEATLDHFVMLKGVNDGAERKRTVHQLLEQVNLFAVRKQHVGGFSGGMRQRLGIAIALSGNPSLVIVDEPTSGLDPNERFRFLNLLAAISADVVVILSTHIVQDIEALCRRVAILNRGTILATGAPSELASVLRGQVWRARLDRASVARLTGEHTLLSVRMIEGDVDVLVRAESPPADTRFAPVEPDLEAVFFHHVPSTDLHAQLGL
jgi:ABC-type multidrug transport system ATPase subunit